MWSLTAETQHPLPLAIRIALDPERVRALAVVGPNGAGKTTFLRLLAGLGAIPGEPRRPGANGVYDSAGRRLARVTWIPQEPSLFPHRSIAHQVQWVAGQPDALRRPPLAEWVERLELAPLLHRRPRQLSGGQQQRAALLRALAAAPQVLALDEALAQIDTLHRLQIWEGLRAWLRDAPDRLLLISGHAYDEVADQVDQAAVLWEGRLLRLAPPARLRADPGSWAVASLVGYQAWVPLPDLPGQGRAVRTSGLRPANGPAPGPAVAAAVLGRSEAGIWVRLESPGVVGRREFVLADWPHPVAVGQRVWLAVEGPVVPAPA